MYKSSKTRRVKCLPVKKSLPKSKYEYNSYNRHERLTIPSTFPPGTESIHEQQKTEKRHKNTPYLETPSDLSSNQSYYRSPSDPSATSIFKEINEKYQQLELQNYQRKKIRKHNSTPSCSTPIYHFTNHIQSKKLTRTPIQRVSTVWTDNNFSINLSKRIKVQFKRNSLTECLKNIKKHIQCIDTIISGERKLEKPNNLVHKTMEKQNNEEMSGGFKLLPKSMWVYRTPTKQKIGKPVLGASSIKTALMQQTPGQRSAIFEIKRNQNFNLNRYNTGRNVSIDIKYLEDDSNDSNAFCDREIRRNPKNCRPENRLDVLEESNITYFQPVIEQPNKRLKSISRYNSNELLQRGNLFENYTEDGHQSSPYFDGNNVTFAPLCLDVDKENNKRLFTADDLDTPKKRKKIFNFRKSPTLFNFSNMNQFNV